MKYVDIARDIISKYTELTVGYIHPNDIILAGELIITTDQSISDWLTSICNGLNNMLGLRTSSVKPAQWTNDASSVSTNKTGAWSWKIIQGRFYMMPSNMAMPTGLYYEAKSGLISVNENFDGDGKNKEGKFNINVMMDPRINSSSIINVKRKDGKLEYYKVSTFKFVGDGDTHQVEMQCILIKDINNIGYLGVPIEIEPVDDMEYGDDYG
jgi:hypothetical protein